MTFKGRRFKAAEASARLRVRGLSKAAAEMARRSRTGKPPMLNPGVVILITCEWCGWRGPAADPLACGGCGASLAAAQSAVALARAALGRDVEI